jgi:glycosyltransferase involved in cell wall biosynthesis
MAAQRILILTNRVPHPQNDGGNLAMNAMIEGYHESGWEVYLLAMNTSRHKVARETLAGIYNHIHAFETIDTNNDVTILGLLKNYLFSRLPNHVSRLVSSNYADRLEEVIAAFKPDIIQVESVYLSGYLDFIKVNTSAPIVLRLHNIEYKIWRRFAHEAVGFFKKKYLKNLTKRIRRYEQSAWRKYDLLLPITDNDAETLKKNHLSAKAYTVAFGIDTSKIIPTVDIHEWSGYHLGAMDWLPNVEGIKWFLDRPWQYIHKLAPGFRFYFAGRNMPEYFKKMDINGVVCAGEVPDANEFIKDKKILIVPLRSGGGIRVKILEAMAAGKIIISTDVGMQGIYAWPGTHYLAANDVKDFGKVVNWCLMHKQEAEKIAEQATELIKTKYDRKVIMAHLLERLDVLIRTK